MTRLSSLLDKCSIFGGEKSFRPLQPVIETHCHYCARDTLWDLFEITEWLTLNQLRLISMSQKPYLGCSLCSDFVEISDKHLNGILSFNQLSEKESYKLHQHIVNRIECSQLAKINKASFRYIWPLTE